MIRVRKQDVLLSIASASTLFLAISVPVIDEKCCHCGQRVLQGNAPLRKLSIVEWAFDRTQDFHFSCFKEHFNG